jgi:hypothetical protein
MNNNPIVVYTTTLIQPTPSGSWFHLHEPQPDANQKIATFYR